MLIKQTRTVVVTNSLVTTIFFIVEVTIYIVVVTIGIVTASGLLTLH